MTDFLRTLSDREQLLYQRTIAFTGTMESRLEQLRSSSIGEEYRQLHAEYWAILHASPNRQEQLELLKRLVFINWYQWAEPSIYSGIDELDEEVVQAAYSLLDRWLSQSSLDQELRWMLSYYATWDYAILPFSENHLPFLTAFVKEVSQSASSPPYQQLPHHSMDNRGLMGRYWQSVGVEIP
jgi:hypothetical protein